MMKYDENVRDLRTAQYRRDRRRKEGVQNVPHADVGATLDTGILDIKSEKQPDPPKLGGFIQTPAAATSGEVVRPTFGKSGVEVGRPPPETGTSVTVAQFPCKSRVIVPGTTRTTNPRK